MGDVAPKSVYKLLSIPSWLLTCMCLERPHISQEKVPAARLEGWGVLTAAHIKEDS